MDDLVQLEVVFYLPVTFVCVEKTGNTLSFNLELDKHLVLVTEGSLKMLKLMRYAA